MASQQSIVDHILDQIQLAGNVRAKKMFGDYGIFCNDRMVALVSDDELYVKPTKAGQKLTGDCVEGPPYPGAKPCYIIPEDKLANEAWLCELIAVTAAELPLPKRKNKA